jgi:hypothetical protein
MKTKFRNKGVMILILLLLASTAATAGNIALRGGYTPSGYSTSNGFTYATGSDGGTVTRANGSALDSGLAVECYWMADGLIHDPNYSGPNPNVLIGSVKYVGNDSDSWNTFSGTAGKFYHDYSAAGAQFTSGNNFYFRVWDNAAPATGGALFGESGTVTANYDANIYPFPANNGLTPDLRVQFTQDMPASPSFSDADVLITQAQSGGNPTIRVSTHSAIHGRWYEFQVSNTSEAGSFTAVYPYITDSAANPQHAADKDSTSVKTGSTKQLGRYDDGTYVKVRVRACNDYGNSNWVESGPLLIPVTQSSNRPTVVSDLQASRGANSITLTWTAPYLQDPHGAVVAASGYDIRISTSPIVDTWEAGNSNPTHITNWANTISISAAPYNFDLAHFAIKTYQDQDPRQTLIVPNVPSGTYYLALKSFNGTVPSYISNVTGAQVGAGGGGGLGGGLGSWILTIESRVAAGGHGINHFSLPFAGPWFVYKEDGVTLLGEVATAYDLVKAIDSAAGSNIVSTFTRWVGANSTPNETGVIITDSNPDAAEAADALRAIALDNGTAFELYASQPVKVVIKNYQ